MTSVVHRLLLSWIPAAAIVVLTGVGFWGENGLMVRGKLRRQVEVLDAERSAIDRDNRRLLRELRATEQDPLVLERAVADELGLVRPGSTLVRFEDGVGPDR